MTIRSVTGTLGLGVALALTLAATSAGCGTDGSDGSTTDSTETAGGEEPSMTADEDTGTGSSTTHEDPTTESIAPTTSDPAAGQPTTVPEPRALVVIDPGHNGANGAHPDEINRPVDAGGFEKACNTVGSSTDDGITESSINWELAQALRDSLEQSEVEVVLTRDSDDGVGPCIDQRARVAADAQADLLVSLHADGAGPELGGFHVIHPGLRPGYTDQTVDPSADLAAAVRDALVDEGFTPHLPLLIRFLLRFPLSSRKICSKFVVRVARSALTAPPR